MEGRTIRGMAGTAAVLAAFGVSLGLQADEGADEKLKEGSTERQERLADTVDVGVGVGEGGVFREGDGKILGIPLPEREREKKREATSLKGEAELKGPVEDAGSAGERGGGGILGFPKRGFEKLRLRDLPERVRKTVRREAQGRKVTRIGRAEKEGRRLYEIDLEGEGLKRALKIGADGRVVADSDRETAFGSPAQAESGEGREKQRPNLLLTRVPKEVQKTIARTVAEGEAMEINEVERDGEAAYEVKVAREGVERTIEISPEGEVLAERVDE